MNAYKLNGAAGQMLLGALVGFLGFNHADIYKEVKNIIPLNDIFIMRNGDRYKIKFEKID
jgi:uncharacterized protein (DUF111 family)